MKTDINCGSAYFFVIEKTEDSGKYIKKGMRFLDIDGPNWCLNPCENRVFEIENETKIRNLQLKRHDSKVVGVAHVTFNIADFREFKED